MTQTKVILPHKFICRPYQIKAWKALEAGKKKVVLCWHRGAGKDLFALNWIITRAMRRQAVYLHCFPNYAQGKKAIWNSIHQTDDGEPLSYLSHFPPEIIKHKDSSDMRIQLTNGSVYQVIGIDGKNAQLARGMNPMDVIISEYAFMSEESWDIIEPRVAQNGGTVLFVSTPNGQNHFYREYNYANSGHRPDYYASIVTNDDTHIHTLEHIEELRDKGKPEDFIQQEYFCSFTRGAQGSYYGAYIQQARDSGRISDIRVSKDIVVHTAWDIGIGDASAIWLYQLMPGNSYNLLHYYENNNEGLAHYIQYLDEWKRKHGIIWGKHFVPHDMKNREFTSGVDRVTKARELGYDMTVIPAEKLGPGIEAVRSILPHCTFNGKECRRGIDCLDFYRKKWNDSLKVYYDEPLHDQYSHGADAFRMMAIGVKMFGGDGKLTADQIKEYRMKHMGY